MSWANGAILSEDEVKMKAGHLPCEFQIGEPVCFWIEDGEKVSMMEAYVVGIAITGMHRVRYDLAFQIGTTPYYCVMKDARGRVTHKAQGFRGHDLVDDPTQAPPAEKPRPPLSLVRKEYEGG